MTGATQNVKECLRSDTARLMFANSEFLVLLNQAATDRAELARLTSGDRITDASLVSAGELLDGAEVYKKTI